MISIILPVYNVEQYLKHCIDSILNSTYEDFELIVVNDCSTDGTGAICDDFASRDKRVKVITHQANAGVSAARNTALDIAKGEYITFVDGDDTIHPMMLETLFSAINTGDYDFSMVHYRFIEKEEMGIILEENKKVPTNAYQELSQDAFMRGLLDNSIGSLKYNFIWNKLYKRDLVENLRFVDTAIQDLEWNCRVCVSMKAKKAIIVKDKLYYYLHRTDSISRGIGKRYIDRINSYFICLQDIPQENTSYRAQCLDMLYKVMAYTLYDIKLRDDKELLKECKSVRSSIYHETKSEFMKCGLSWSKKMMLMVLYHVPSIYPVFKMIFELKTKLSS